MQTCLAATLSLRELRHFRISLVSGDFVLRFLPCKVLCLQLRTRPSPEGGNFRRTPPSDADGYLPERTALVFQPSLGQLSDDVHRNCTRSLDFGFRQHHGKFLASDASHQFVRSPGRAWRQICNCSNTDIPFAMPLDSLVALQFSAFPTFHPSRDTLPL